MEVPGSEGRTLFLRATFGILVSRDAGKTFHYICERTLGYEGTWDPPIAATRDGRLWVGLEHGLVSTLDGCATTRAPELEGETVKDLTVDAAGELLLAITGAPGKPGFVWRREKDGAWKRLGRGLPDTNVMTVEIAPSRPSRVYVTGQPYGTIRGRLYRSDDGGATLVGDANALEADGPLFIAAVDPKDPARVLLRHLHARASDLLVTRDAGKTFHGVLSMQSAMFGFAKSGDGRTYWAGSGLASDGVLRSDDGGEHFTKVGAHGVLCLESTAVGLFACENPLTLGAQAVARSDDRGTTFTALGGFADVRGAVACDAAAACGASAWEEVLAFVTPRAAPAPAPAPSPTPAPSSGRCHCSVPGGAVDPPWSGLGALALLAWARAHTRRGSRVVHPDDE